MFRLSPSPSVVTLSSSWCIVVVVVVVLVLARAGSKLHIIMHGWGEEHEKKADEKKADPALSRQIQNHVQERFVKGRKSMDQIHVGT